MKRHTPFGLEGALVKKGRPGEHYIQHGRKTNVEHNYCYTTFIQLPLLPTTTKSLVGANVPARQTSEINIKDDHTYSCMDMMPSDGEVESDFESNYRIEPQEIVSCFDNESELIINDTDIAENVTIACDAFDLMFDDLLHRMPGMNQPLFVTKDKQIRVMEHYKTSVNTCVVVNKDFTVEVLVHNKVVPASNSIFYDLGKGVNILEDLIALLNKLTNAHVCIGNPEKVFLELVPEGSYVTSSSRQTLAFREGNFGAQYGTFFYTSTIRAVDCDLVLTAKNDRCVACSRVRAVLRNREYRRKQSATSVPKSLSHSNYKHSNMDRTKLISKISEQKSEIKNLQSEVNKLTKQLTKQIKAEGHTLSENESLELGDMMAMCDSKVKATFPDKNSFQRLFWEQQLKETSIKKKGMRWHPMIIRWCLYLRHTSNKAYEALCESGFVKLPSSRTLFDYSHFTRSTTGATVDTVKLLREEAEKMGMHTAEWKSWVGLLFDEIRIKEDLVYNKHTGELIGFVDLDSVGNKILDLEQQLKQTNDRTLAKYMLVVMVRGLSSNLKFPLVGYATNSITADFLYPVIWKSVFYVEMCAKLKVLCITCDGASSNRKFFKLHSDDGSDKTCYTQNPHDLNRNIYFISDAPHLLKTARNCFSNSFFHKNSRVMCKNNKHISWRHIVRLYEDHCQSSVYSPCPKLTSSHVNLNAFSIMKVNLAAQILSCTVANALEHLYGDEVDETVIFLRKFNKFFDCLNVRSIYEGRNKRNANLDAYTQTDDVRLDWLTGEFLSYLEDWRVDAMRHDGNLTQSQKKMRMLSQQTINGLDITCRSVSQCVKVLLDSGVPFVLTHCFNQDPLEQHFGHYRHRGGGGGVAITTQQYSM